MQKGLDVTKCRMGRVIAVVVAAVLMPLQSVWAEQSDDFEQWRQAFREEALEKGISAAIFDEAFKGVKPIPKVVKLDRKQPEFTQTLDQYLTARISKDRVKRGKKKFAENKALLTKVANEFGVQPRFLVSFWGMETNYGRFTGGYSVIAAITTLAFDGRRSQFFRNQLLDALHILEEGHITPSQMKGSWAGAMGQAQFMPSTFRAYAVDGDGDGKIDIWNSKADVFSSAANYLSKVGWTDDLTWGREVEIPKTIDIAEANLKIKKPLSEWQAMGIRRLEGRDLPERDVTASLVLPDGNVDGRAYLVYENYHAILDWNRSHKFAVAVGTLADRIVR
ncbi:lytic transglycosylase domain-containing protein [Pseudomonadota bacterium]